MVNYKIVNTDKIANTGGFDIAIADILETKTDQIILSGLGMQAAKAMVRHLNFGGAFDGFTPAFFLSGNIKFCDID